VTQASDIRYFFKLEGDRVPISNHMTVGRHLDNDVLLAGEDVLDYHLRIEMTDRGPQAVPLAEASLRVNGRDLASEVGLMPGDRLDIGQSQMEVDVELVHPPEADRWSLHGSRNGGVRTLDGVCRVGRGEDNDLELQDDHVSRHHAELATHAGIVWLRDLGSSNGTYVNGERITGACRLFHGDEVRFDTLSFQLIGRGADLTPVREGDAAPSRPVPLPAGWRQQADPDTTEIAVVEEPAVVQPVSPLAGEAGAFLLGASDPVAGMTFRTPMGRTLIGRSDECDVVIRDRTVSARHAELMVRAEGVTITNMMSTNGTRLNGDEVQTARLHDGDVLRFGRVSLVFKDVPPTEDGRPWLRRAQLALLVASLILAAGLITFLI